MSAPRHPISIDNFSHVCIGVSDIDTSLAIYTDVLGMDVGGWSVASSAPSWSSC